MRVLAMASQKGGSGKTTLLTILGTMRKPSEGKLRLLGTDIVNLHGRALDVVRNRIRRLVREWLRLHGWVPAGWEVVVVAKASAAGQRLRDDFIAYLDGFSPNVQEILTKFNFRNQIQKLVDAGKLDVKGTIDHAALKAAGVARGGKDGVRVLGKGSFTAKLSFNVAGVSAGAKAAIEAAGGSVTVIEVVPAAEKAAAKKGKVRAARLEARKA